MEDLSHPAVFLKFSLLIFLGIFGRYALIALLFQYLFKVRYRQLFAGSEVNTRPRRRQQNRREIGYSLVSSAIFAALFTGMLVAWQQGWTKIYLDWQEYPTWWLIGSLVLLLFVQETYYYWLHRWMHLPGVYRWVHRVHHDSITTSAWTSFSFHPTESLLQSVALIVLPFVLPVHYAVLGLVVLIMTTTSVINHLNTEIYPRGFYRNPVGKWWIGATHHSLHHSQFRYNYGLYFTFWDRWMKTESPDFKRLFESKARKGQPERNNGVDFQPPVNAEKPG
jgi:lathosterol oxidase